MKKMIQKKKIDEILSRFGSEKEFAIPILQAVQSEYGYLPQDVMEYITTQTDIMPTELYGVATFFKQFRFTPVGKNMIKICKGTACHVKGADRIIQALKEEINAEEGETTRDGLFTFESVACLGCCSLAPVIMINNKIYGRLTPDSVRGIIKSYKEKG